MARDVSNWVLHQNHQNHQIKVNIRTAITRSLVGNNLVSGWRRVCVAGDLRIVCLFQLDCT